MARSHSREERRTALPFSDQPGVLALVLAVLLPAAAAAGATRYLQGKIIISAEAMPRTSGSESTCHGYAEYRVSVMNRDLKAHRITLVLPGNPYGASGHNVREISRTIVVGPNSPALVPLAQPPVPLGGSDIGVYIDGRRRRPDVSCPDAQHVRQGWGHTRVAVVLASRGVSQSLRTKAQSMDVLGNTVSVYQSETPVAQWSGSWLAYSRYDGLIVTGKEMQQMAASAMEAITRYIECGGSLFVTNGNWREPTGWQPYRLDLAGAPRYFIGFGECRVQAAAARGGPLELDSAKQMWEQSYRPWAGSNRKIQEANRIFPVIEDLQVPVRGLFILMLLFAVGIGPVNLIVLAKKRRRIWMLWTVPVISLTTCAAVFAYATFAEGLRGHRRAETLTILDQRTHRAATIGWAAFYSPLTPGDGLHFSYETDLAPQIGLGWGDSGSSRTMNWTNDQHLASGWVSARVPAHFMVRKSQTRRERIVLRRSGGGLSAVNGLGAHIRKLYVADEHGRVYQAADIKPGAASALTPKPGSKRVLAPTTRSSRGIAKAAVLRNAYSTTDWTGNVARFTRTPETHLRPDSYIAVLDATPFLEEGLKGARPRNCVSVVYGILSPTEQDKP